jgi:RNA polymerase sigma-70 factor (ECF subfamily)
VPLEILLENHRAFLAYLTKKVGDRELAEDILQDAFAKLVDRPGLAPGDEGLVPWFYRMIRNAAIDQFRRRGAAARAAEAFSREVEGRSEPDSEFVNEICACVSRLASTLKPEYAEALDAIDARGTAIKTFAAEHGLSAGNAGVRVFRARAALKRRVTESCGTCADHGCLLLLSIGQVRQAYSVARRRRRALTITETELNVIAALAQIGLIRMPSAG